MLADVNPGTGVAVHTLRVHLVGVLRHQGAMKLGGTHPEKRHQRQQRQTPLLSPCDVHRGLLGVLTDDPVPVSKRTGSDSSRGPRYSVAGMLLGG